MRNIKRAFWALLALLSVLWLAAEPSLFQSKGFFAFRAAMVQYSGTVAIGAMSVAMLPGIAPALAGTVAGRTGQDVPSAQVAGHRRPRRRRGPLALGQGAEMGGGVGLARTAGARRQASAREPGRGVPDGLARHRGGCGRMGLLRRRAVDRAGARQVLSLPALLPDPPPARHRLSGAGVPCGRADGLRQTGRHCSVW